MQVETIGDATLYLGDCMEILPTLGKVDAVITDPPYNIGKDAWGSTSSWSSAGVGKARMWGVRPDWDVAPSAHLLGWIISHHAIVWGANYFDNMPATKGWLVWDKCADMTQAQAELAWSNIAPNARVFKRSPLGVFGNGGANDEIKVHPTQKPLGLMRWCVEFAKDMQIILDPFMGSGTTGVAAVERGKTFVGIEREPKYFDIACKRIEQAYKQRPLFEAEPPPKPVQLGLEAA
jgi:site-specific DNA-methyltransferase (adenine-specific)/modification methylase